MIYECTSIMYEWYKDTSTCCTNMQYEKLQMGHMICKGKLGLRYSAAGRPSKVPSILFSCF